LLSPYLLLSSLKLLVELVISAQACLHAAHNTLNDLVIRVGKLDDELFQLDLGLGFVQELGWVTWGPVQEFPIQNTQGERRDEFSF